MFHHMGSTELAANLFSTTQAADKLRRENARSKDRAGQIHKDVGRKVRQIIRELGGTMPEILEISGLLRPATGDSGIAVTVLPDISANHTSFPHPAQSCHPPFGHRSSYPLDTVQPVPWNAPGTRCPALL